MQSLLILGRQPNLGLAELISLYGDSRINLVSDQAAVVDIDPCNFKFDRLGGSTKFCKLLGEMPNASWPDIEDYLVKTAPEQSLKMPDGKMTLGLSLYGFKIDPRSIITSGIKLKKAIQKTGRSVRIVPNKTLDLNTAQIIHNKLTSDRAWELVIVKSKDKSYIAQTVKVQDIEAYTKRDQVRPFRDSRVGMLPPKLAQIIINLAVGPLPAGQLNSVCEEDGTIASTPEPINQTVLDPFCGTGVVLQEAALMGYKIIGSDISDRMVDYTKKNLDWLKSKFNINNVEFVPENIVIADATNASWQPFDFVATETNLGKPLSRIPESSEMNDIIRQANNIIEKFLVNLAKQLKPGSRLCVAIPAWQISKDNFKYLPLIDQIDDLGYNFVDFKHQSAEQLIYYRPEQIVARQLLVIIRK